MRVWTSGDLRSWEDKGLVWDLWKHPANNAHGHGGGAWQVTVPVIVRAMLVAQTADGGELVFSAGVAEGKTRKEWDESRYWRGPARLLVHSGADGKQLHELDLPACPVFDGIGAANGRLFLALSSGEVVCLGRP